MRFHPSGLLLAVPLLWAGLTACQAGGRESGDAGGTSNGSTTGNGSGGNGGTTLPDGSVIQPDGTVVLPDGTVAKMLPARIRRLTNSEYDATVQALLGTQQTFAANFAVDARQSDFTRNDQQRVDPLLAGQYQAAAEELAAEAVAPEKLSTLVPCAIASGDRTCAEGFIDSWVSKAFRRPLTDEDRAALLTVYDVGIEGGTFTDGIQLVIQAALQSASFLYHSEIGSGDPAAPGIMTGHEIAAELSYLFLGGPPDAALLTAADAGELATSEGRLAQAQRLLAMPEALPQLERLVLEWLGIDGIANLAKDATLFPNWEELRPALLKETQAFVDEVMVNDGSRVSALIGANYTVVDGSQALNDLYGLPAGTTGKITLEDNTRRGILTQPSFLARRAKDAESAPVPRGVTILRRVLCITVPDPASLNLNVVPPPPDPTQTTRERFSVHAADPDCASCHDLIDGVGFTFESYDAVGKYRTTDNGKPVDSTGYVDSGTDIDGDYANAVELVEAMSGSERVKKCVAGHFYRFAAARSDDDEEDGFVEGVWGNLNAEQQDSVYELLLNFVNSALFVSRRPE